MLQIRSTWLKAPNNVKVDVLVLLREDNIPPLKWPWAIIIELILSIDVKVRVLLRI